MSSESCEVCRGVYDALGNCACDYEICDCGEFDCGDCGSTPCTCNRAAIVITDVIDVRTGDAL